MILLSRRFIALFALTWLPLLYGHAQEKTFNHITTEDGLLTGNVRTILKDYQGFFWFGTEDGLQRYDGYTMINYLHDEKDSTSLSSNFILYLFEDSKNNLWVGTLDAGLCLYDRSTDSFKRFIHDPADKNSILGNYVRVIHESYDSTIYIGLAEGGFSYFKTSSHIPSSIRFTNIAIPKLKSTDANMVGAIVEDADHTLLIGVNGIGLNHFDPATGAFKKMLPDSCSNRIHNLFLDSKNRIWIGSWDNGLYIYDRHSKQIVHHTSDNSPGSLPHHQIESIFGDREGNFWIGTDNGLCLIPNSVDPFSKTPFITFRHNAFESSSLLSNSIKAFSIDNQDRIWIASYYGGINIFNKSSSKFSTIKSKPWASESLSNNNVFAFAQDNQDKLWIGTDGGGLNVLTQPITDIEKGNFIKVPLELDGKPVNKIKCIETDHQGNLWIGTWGSGMFKLNSKTNSYEHYGIHPKVGMGISANEVLTIKADSLDNVWIGTFNGGLNYFDHKHKTFTYYTSFFSKGKSGQINRITSLHIDRNGKVWVAREVGGLNFFDPQTQSFIAIEQGVLSKHLTIISIHEDKGGVLWLGTNSIGLIRYDPLQNSVKLYNEDSGMPNNVVHAILENPSNGNLWLSTNKGLSVLDVSSEVFVNYTKADGLQGNQFNPGSAFLHSSGIMLFGGISGMNAFDPAKIKKSTQLFPVIFSRFWLNDKEVNIRNPGSPLSKNIILDQQINLSHNQNSFSIEFAMLEYDFANRNEYSYFLEGLTTTWQNIGTQRKATFTNLDPGTYLLKVKASNSDGLWNEEGASLIIHVLPPWWLTIWAKTLWIALFLGSFFALYKTRTSSLKAQRKRLQIQVEERTNALQKSNEELNTAVEELNSVNENLSQAYTHLKDLDQYKESMTAMIVHDFKNSLNTVIGFSEGTPTERRLKSIRQAGQFMLNMVLNILDVQKFEAAEVKLSLANYPIAKVMNDAIQQMSYLLDQKSIKLTYIENDLCCRIDYELLTRTTINILSNAIKYVPTNGAIKIITEKHDDYLVISIEDNGPGIPADKVHLVFDKYAQINAEKSGGVRSTGIGLAFCKMVVEAHSGTIGVESEVGKGSKFYFTVPWIHDTEQLVGPTQKRDQQGDESIELSEEEIVQLKPVLDELKKWEVYDYSETNAILERIKNLDGNISTWRERLEKAIHNGNEQAYNQLVNLDT